MDSGGIREMDETVLHNVLPSNEMFDGSKSLDYEHLAER
jgi:hypothetical protein